jgi:hypothetical protein
MLIGDRLDLVYLIIKNMAGGLEGGPSHACFQWIRPRCNILRQAVLVTCKELLPEVSQYFSL